ncbi:CHASE2 domain-containing protein, partial [bacterium]|nr:CHASE2 domain-containing protein [bacterium]
FYKNLQKIPNFSFVQVLQSYLQFIKGKTPIISPHEFQDKIVIVGSTASGASDIRPVSGVSNYPLFGIHVSFLENFINDTFIKKIDNPATFLITFFLSSFTLSISSMISLWMGLAFIIFFSFLFVYFSFWIFSTHSLWINIFAGVSSIIITYLVYIVYQFIFEKREKLKIKNLFKKYLSPEVMEKLLSYEKEITLSGEEKYITVVFADIRGFTSIAERLSPEETFEFLNKILSVMAKSIFKFGGTLDKFIGDEIMAIFGAPVEDKEHAKKAVFASIEMMKNMKNVSKFVKIGIGINTGKMMVGNIGTEERMEYTAIGDAVNLASRIEKIAGPEEILITETTYHQVKDVVKCEFLGEREIRGKEKRVRIYRVIWEEQK